jgi:hypothetical protein
VKPNEKLYEFAAKELKEAPRKGLLIKCIADANGNSDKGNSLYIKRRVAELKSESTKQNFFHAFDNLSEIAKSLFRKCLPSGQVVFILMILNLVFSIIIFTNTETRNMFDSFPYFMGYLLSTFLVLFVPAYLIGIFLKLISRGKISLDVVIGSLFIIGMLLSGFGTLTKTSN